MHFAKFDQIRPGERLTLNQSKQESSIEDLGEAVVAALIDEMLYEIVEATQRVKARRLVIDSLSGFELALAPTFREDFRESLYRMVAVRRR